MGSAAAAVKYIHCVPQTAAGRIHIGKVPITPA